MDSVKTVGREPTPDMLAAGRGKHNVLLETFVREAWYAMWDKAAASPTAGTEVVAVLSAYHGPNGPEVSVGVLRPDDFPVVNDRVTKYPLYARPPTPSTDAVRRQAREEALAEFIALAEAEKRRCRARGAQAEREGNRTKEDLWLVCGDTAGVIADQALSLSTPPAGAAALNEGEKP